MSHTVLPIVEIPHPDWDTTKKARTRVGNILRTSFLWTVHFGLSLPMEMLNEAYEYGMGMQRHCLDWHPAHPAFGLGHGPSDYWPETYEKFPEIREVQGDLQDLMWEFAELEEQLVNIYERVFMEKILFDARDVANSIVYMGGQAAAYREPQLYAQFIAFTSFFRALNIEAHMIPHGGYNEEKQGYAPMWSLVRETPHIAGCRAPGGKVLGFP